MHSKENYKQNEKTTYIMGENICKIWDQQRLNFQNLQTAHIAQYKKKKPSKKMGIRPKYIFLQRRHTDGYQAHEKMLNIANY